MANGSVIVTQDGFEFRKTDNGFAVFRRKGKVTASFGNIVTHQEANGRHCFRLGCDDRETPRTYRGKVTAANALLRLNSLLSDPNLKQSNVALVLAAWECVPSTV